MAKTTLELPDELMRVAYLLVADESGAPGGRASEDRGAMEGAGSP